MSDGTHLASLLRHCLLVPLPYPRWQPLERLLAHPRQPCRRHRRRPTIRRRTPLPVGSLWGSGGGGGGGCLHSLAIPEPAWRGLRHPWRQQSLGSGAGDAARSDGSCRARRRVGGVQRSCCNRVWRVENPFCITTAAAAVAAVADQAEPALRLKLWLLTRPQFCLTNQGKASYKPFLIRN